jgi:hypothetical protein
MILDGGVHQVRAGQRDGARSEPALEETVA